MEKYGVVTETEKQASKQADGLGCPWCGEKVAMVGGIVMCPKHGTEPFEPKDTNKRR